MKRKVAAQKIKSPIGRVQSAIKQKTHTYIVCPVCRNLGYRKHWYTAKSPRARQFKSAMHTVLKQHCPACVNTAGQYHSGVVIVRAAPVKYWNKTVSVIGREAEKSLRHNPKHRLLELVATHYGFKARTSTAALAQHIGKKLQHLYRASKQTEVHQEYPRVISRDKIIFKGVEYLDEPRIIM